MLEGGKIPIVDRHKLAHIREEMNLQLSGEVSDESALSIGKFLGVQFIITGTLTNMGTHQRFRIRVINVETAAIQKQITLELQNDSQVTILLNVKPIPVRYNWFSGELSGIFNMTSSFNLGVGLTYEHMLNTKISVGVNVFFRFYPFGKTFFLGVRLGFAHAQTEYDYISKYVNKHEIRDASGLIITPELGWKIDVGNIAIIALAAVIIIGVTSCEYNPDEEGDSSFKISSEINGLHKEFYHEVSRSKVRDSY